MAAVPHSHRNGASTVPIQHETPPLSEERLGGPAPDWLTVDEAMERVVSAFLPLEDYERVPLVEALGRVLVEDVPADSDVPPFTNVAVDGFAVRADDVAGANAERPVALQVIGRTAAGAIASQVAGRGEAYRVLTGAPLPPGTDAVVPYEQTDGSGFGGWGVASPADAAGTMVGRGDLGSKVSTVRIFRPVEKSENVRYAGEDQRRGEVILRAGTHVRPAEVGALASLGRAQVWVRRRPRVAVLSTGDEITPIHQPLRPGAIRDANAHALAALISQYGGEALPLGIAPDDAEAVRARLSEAITAGADLLVTSGGVSLGDHDVVKRVLREDGEIAFWTVDIRPGRPICFGRFHGVPLLALPGNPVAVMVTFELFVRPALLRLAGHTRWRKVEIFATALQAITNRSGRENFMRAVVDLRPREEGEPEWVVRLTGEQGSGIITSMVKANALVRLVRGQRRVEPGERVRAVMLDWPPLGLAGDPTK
jgi:molybdopterin molybdotransferase